MNKFVDKAESLRKKNSYSTNNFSFFESLIRNVVK